MRNGLLLADEAIEERRLADVGSPYDCYDGHFGKDQKEKTKRTKKSDQNVLGNFEREPEVARMQKFDLEDRLLRFSTRTRDFVKRVPVNLWIREYCRQVIRSSGSVTANYIEANETVGNKDFRYRLRLSRKESKETRLWLQLIDLENKEYLEEMRSELLQEAIEIVYILTSIIGKARKG